LIAMNPASSVASPLAPGQAAAAAPIATNVAGVVS
jgi:hypothetical protein